MPSIIFKMTYFSNIIISLFFLSAIVVPNALRFEKVPLLLFTLCFLLPYIANARRESVIFLTCGILVTAVYFGIGIQSTEYPQDLTNQILTVYVLAPIFWVFFSRMWFGRFGVDGAIKIFLLAALLICLQTVLGFWLIGTGKAELFELFINSPNAVIRNESVGIRLHAFGSLIFFGAAIFGLLTKKISPSILLLVGFITLTAVSSGRSALVLSVLMGGIFYFIFSIAQGKTRHFLIFTPVLVVGSFLLIYFVAAAFDVDALAVLSLFTGELAAGGGSIKQEQMGQLISGINSSYGLGEGHGALIEMRRHYVGRPWGLEVLGLATVYRVGFIGTIIYAFPFLISLYRYFYLVMARAVNHKDNFFMFGLVMTIISTFTNPYLESIEFQWMLFLPYVYFHERVLTRKTLAPSSNRTSRRRRRKI